MLTFEPNNSEQEDSENDGDDNEQESQEEDESEPDAPEPQLKKKRAVRGPREFKEVDRWDRGDSTEEEIIVFICRHLDECNQNASIQHVPGKYKDSKNICGDFQLRRTWMTNRNLVTNTILSCPLRDRCNCQCQATPAQTILFIADLHTAADHVGSKDRIKFLKQS